MAENLSFGEPPVAADGTVLPIVIGDDYLAANNRAFDFFVAPVAGVDINTVQCWFGAEFKHRGKWLVSGTVALVVDRCACGSNCQRLALTQTAKAAVITIQRSCGRLRANVLRGLQAVSNWSIRLLESNLEKWQH